MKLHLWTQDQENYGTEEQPYWKFKGGEDFFVLPYNDIPAPALAEMMRPIIEQDNPYFRRQIVGFEMVEDDYLTEFEQDQLEFDGRIVYPTRVFNLSESA